MKTIIKKVKESLRSIGKVDQRAEPISPKAKNIQGMVLNPKVGPPVSLWGPR